MSRMLSLITSLLLLGSIPQCEPKWDNLLDETGSNYVPPTISFDPDSSSISKENDTVHYDSVTIYIMGNKTMSRFQFKLDKEDWSTEWEKAGRYVIEDLSDGKHTLYIITKYAGGDSVVSGEIPFFVLVKGYKPELTINKDTVISSYLGKDVKVAVHALGVEPINYEWLKTGDSVALLSGDTLKLSDFSINDTGTYYCIASNKYGEVTSRSFNVKYRPSTGVIKGVIVSASDSAKLSGVEVKLSSSDKSVSTDTYGSFKFDGLSAKDYSISISLSGYYDSTMTGISVNDSGVVDLSTIALLKIILSKVVYDGNDKESGSTPVDTSDYKSGDVVTISDNKGNLKKSGYDFTGWCGKPDGSGKIYNAGDTLVMGSSDDTLFAVWMIKQFSVIFKGNNNTSGTPPEEIKEDFNKKITIPDKGTLERAGYSFSEWNTNDQGTGKGYSGGDEYTIPDSNLILYAIWKKLPTDKVTYDGNHHTNGTAPTDTNSYYSGQKVTVLGNPGKLEKEGFSFAGWNDNDSGTGQNYNAGSTFLMPSSAFVLYAKWTTKQTYLIVYDGNENTGGKAPDMVDFDSGSIITIADSNTLYKTGYSFTGWNTLQNGDGTSYKPGNKQAMDPVSITLYAQWTESFYTITYHGNGNTSGSVPLSSNHLYGTNVLVAEPGNLEKTGHTFYRWNTDSTGNGIDYNAGDQITMNGKDIDLFARWKINEYKITFNTLGGTNIADITVKYGDTIKTPDPPVKNSYTFADWYRDSTCNEKWNFSESKVFGNDTLYAKWMIMDIDSNIYNEITIGNQVWMVENLRTSRFSNGDSIKNISDSIEWKANNLSAFCWYKNDINNNNIYGALYNWDAVSNPKLAPKGWHIPTMAEWDTLIAFLGGANIAGGKIKEASTDYWQPPNGGATNETGFTALPGGGRGAVLGDFNNLGFTGNWWSASKEGTMSAWCYTLHNVNTEIEKSYFIKNCGFSIRCIKDQ